jgi:choline kinase
MSSDLCIVIPTAGLGRRMKSFGPKALINLGDGRTVLRRQLDLLKARYPKADIVVVVGYDGDRVLKTLPAGVRVVENERFEDTSVSRSISIGLRASVASKAIVVYGDLVFNRQTLDPLASDRSCVVVDSHGRLPDDGVGVTVDGGLAVHFDYGLPTKFCHIMMLTGRELQMFRSIGSHREKQRLLGFEVLNEIIERGGELYAVEHRDMSIVEIESSKDITKARGVALA